MTIDAGFLRAKGFELLELAVTVKQDGGDPDGIHRLGIEILCRALALEHAGAGVPAHHRSARLH